MSATRPSNLVWPLNVVSNWWYSSPVIIPVPSDGVTPPISPTPASGNDAYDKYVAELKAFQEILNNDIQSWEKKQIEVLGSVIYPHINPDAPAQETSTIRKFFIELKNKFIGIFESPKAILEKMENEIEPHVKEFEAHLKQECARLHAIADKNSIEAKKIKGEICHLAIEIADAHILLTDNLLAELNKAMADKQFQHDLVNQIMKSIIETFIKIPFPALDFSPSYRNKLYQDVASTKPTIEQDFTESEAIIAEAMLMLQAEDKPTMQIPAAHPDIEIPSDLQELYSNVGTLFSDRIDRRREVRQEQQLQRQSLLSHSL